MRRKITIVTGFTMKVLSVVVLVAAIALVQGRSGVIKNEITAGVQAGQVHLRFAQSGGTLGTCSGALIHNRWVLTSARCLQSATFAWVRYNAAQVQHPELVTESGAAALNGHNQYDGTHNDIGLISINRNVETSAGIQIIRPESSSDAENDLPQNDVPFCSWGSGDEITCSSLDTAGVVPCPTVGGPNTYDSLCSIGSVPFDTNLGTPLIVDNKLVGLVSSISAGSQDGVNANFAVFTRVGKFIEWIESQTGLEFDERPDEEEVGVAPFP